MTQDITYCAGMDCENRDCERHPERLRGRPGHDVVSIADLRPVCRHYIAQVLEEVEKGVADADK